ncbi:proton-conducting transporter membrane subunit [Streptomyces sp. S399]|uniref:proton-conducting transporter transmembrane domain-containing protein n=1 Tax=Streptomyces sp. S399 TaxID=3096009 RepID=UPI002A826604|nr:proton-conducting transporter membrane subunit [Streptomyces sp. S399]WPR54338.1 proton-conducting transporter membrane subunit [Streptomyces sp. S399]
MRRTSPTRPRSCADERPALAAAGPAPGRRRGPAAHRAPRRPGRPTAGAVLAVATCALATVAARAGADATAPFLPGLPARLSVDGLSAPLAVTVAAVAALVLLAGRAGLGPSGSPARFTGLMLIFTGAMLTTVTAATLPVLLTGWEVMGATSWALIGHGWRDREATGAATTAFLTTRGCDLGLYVAAGAGLAGGAASLALDDLARTDEPWRSVTAAGVILAALGKSAQLPFSFWLSGAMRGPAPVSALLHSATMVAAGAYLLLRTGPLLAATGWGAELTAWAGAATALVLGLVAVAQRDLKQLLAASTCAQLGFMVLAAGAGATTGGTLQLLAHAAAKSLLFLLSGAWLSAYGTRLLPGLAGAARLPRALGPLFTTGALCLAGLPPLALWAAKDVLLAAALTRDPWLYATGLAGAALAAVYSTKALWYVWRPAPPAATAPPPGPRCSPRSPCSRWPAPPSPRSPCHPCAPLWSALDSGGGPRPTWGGGPVRQARPRRRGVGLVARRAAPRPARPFTDWLGLERAARALVVRPVLAAARLAAAFDTRVLERATDTVAHGALALARSTDRLAERGLADGVNALAAAVRRAARARGGRRPGSSTSTWPKPSPRSPPSPSSSSSSGEPVPRRARSLPTRRPAPAPR